MGVKRKAPHLPRDRGAFLFDGDFRFPALLLHLPERLESE
jgi:hypothetical protein